MTEAVQRLGKYEIIEEIGKGGFATVYRARDLDLGREVALKVLDPLLTRDPVWVARFRREARAVAMLDHPRIVTVHEIGQSEGALFIAMKLVEGGSLAQRLAQAGPLPWEEAVRVVGQVAEGLDFAHKAGVLHRDLKPANVLLDPRTGAVLTDFGFARLLADNSLSVSMSGGIVGTPATMAPEVWEGQEPTAQADVYALGCILYELVTGQPLFSGATPPAVMLAHFKPLLLPEAWPDGTPPGLGEVLQTALARDPAARYARAGDLAAAVAALSVDRLAEPYAALQAAVAGQQWQQALALAAEIKGSQPDYRDVTALERQALAGLEQAARAHSATQWRATAEEALAAGDLAAAQLALKQWQSVMPEDPELATMKARVQELHKPVAALDIDRQQPKTPTAPVSRIDTVSVPTPPFEPPTKTEATDGSSGRGRIVWALAAVGALLATIVLVIALSGGAERQGTAPVAAPATESPTKVVTLSTANAAPPTQVPAPAATLLVETTSEPRSVTSAESGCLADARTLLIWADDTRAPVLNDLKPKVLEETGVCLDIQIIGFGDIRTQMSLAGQAGEGADIFVGAHDWLGELYTNGAVAPMDLGAKAADFAPVALQAFTYGGTLYGVPYAVENVAFVCNTDLVETLPTTYSELQEMAKEMQDAGTVKQFFALMASDSYHQEPINTAFGGYIFGQTETGYDACDVGLDSEGAIAYLTWIDTMVKDGLLSADVDWETAHMLFETGDAACMITGPWALERFDNAGINYSINPLIAETQDGSPFVGVQGFMINSFSANKVLAQSFLTDYVATTEVMEALYKAGNRPPAYIPAQAAMDDNAKAFAATSVNAHPMPAIPAMNAVWSSWGDAIVTVFQQSATPADAAATAAGQVRTAAGCQ